MQIHICSLLRHQIVIIHLLNLPGLQNTTVKIISVLFWKIIFCSSLLEKSPLNIIGNLVFCCSKCFLFSFSKQHFHDGRKAQQHIETCWKQLEAVSGNFLRCDA